VIFVILLAENFEIENMMCIKMLSAYLDKICCEQLNLYDKITQKFV